MSNDNFTDPAIVFKMDDTRSKPKKHSPTPEEKRLDRQVDYITDRGNDQPRPVTRTPHPRQPTPAGEVDLMKEVLRKDGYDPNTADTEVDRRAVGGTPPRRQRAKTEIGSGTQQLPPSTPARASSSSSANTTPSKSSADSDRPSPISRLSPPSKRSPRTNLSQNNPPRSTDTGSQQHAPKQPSPPRQPTPSPRPPPPPAQHSPGTAYPALSNVQPRTGPANQQQQAGGASWAGVTKTKPGQSSRFVAKGVVPDSKKGGSQDNKKDKGGSSEEWKDSDWAA